MQRSVLLLICLAGAVVGGTACGKPKGYPPDCEDYPPLCMGKCGNIELPPGEQCTEQTGDFKFELLTTANCGPCSASETCVQNMCVPASCTPPLVTTPYCQMQGLQCGAAMYPCESRPGETTPIDCGNCPALQVCSGNKCVEALPTHCRECTGDQDCPDGLACDGVICTRGCTADSDCGADSTCRDSFCTCTELPGGSNTVQGTRVGDSSSLLQALFPVLTSGGYTRTATTPQPECTALAYSGSPEVDSHASGGTITLSKGSSVLATITPSSTDNSYSTAFSNTAFWSLAGGESLTFSGTGGPTIPAFSATALAPSTGTLISPPFPTNSTLTLDLPTGQPMNLGWMNGGTGVLHVDIYGGDGLSELICNFPSNAGSAQIGEAALATLGTGTGGFSATFLSAVQAGSGAGLVTLMLTVAPLNPDGSDYNAVQADIHGGLGVDGGVPDAGPDAGPDGGAGPATCSCDTTNGCTNCPTGTICNLSGSCVVPQYVDSPDAGTVSDQVTGLVWQQSVASVTYQWSGATPPAAGSAQDYCANLNLAGFSTGWRVPTLKELWSLVYGTTAQTIDGAAFTATPANYFWTATPATGGPSGFAWVVGFDTGYTFTDPPTVGYSVRCVR